MSQISALAHLRRLTQVDADTFDVHAIKDEWECVDATSNQAEIFDQASKPENADLVRSSVELARTLTARFPEVTMTELAIDIVTVQCALRVARKVPGCLHIMANPKNAYNTGRVVQNGLRYHEVVKALDPNFDLSRIVMKVAATWEGLQACSLLTASSVKTLATTVTSVEQSILAAEAGCVSVSPFIHELKSLFEESYSDKGPELDICVKSQSYFEANNLPTRVKACANASIEEILLLAGIKAFTIMVPDLEALAATPFPGTPSLLGKANGVVAANKPYVPVYLQDEAKFRKDFSAARDGASQFKLMQALAIFSDYQDKLDLLVRGFC